MQTSICKNCRPHRRQRGGAVLHALIFVTGVTLGWIGWTSLNPTVHAQARPAGQPILNPPTSSGSGSTPRVSEITTATNGAIIIPVRDAAGNLREPMVLVPIKRRTDAKTNQPAAGNTPAPTPPAASPISTASLTNPASSTNPTTAASLVGSNSNNSLRLSNRAGVAGISTNQSQGRASSSDKIIEAQVSLVQHGISPGSIDGLMGSQTRAALRAFQRQQGLPVNGNLDETVLARLHVDGPIYTNYTVSENDVGRIQPLSKTWLGKSQQSRLEFESVLELVAENTFTHPNLLRRLNPLVNWTNISPGTELKILAVQQPDVTEKATSLQIRLAERTLEVFGANSNLLAHYPCSIAQRVEKRPVGEALHVAVVAPDPNYTFDPAVFPESPEAQELGRKLILQPGPNNPVGVVWIGLDKPGYGIHGTPKPEDVGRTESHGCFRLANWNARHLLDLVAIGTPVVVLP